MASVQLLGLLSDPAIDLGASSFGLGQSPLGGRRKPWVRAPLRCPALVACTGSGIGTRSGSRQIFVRHSDSNTDDRGTVKMPKALKKYEVRYIHDIIFLVTARRLRKGSSRLAGDDAI
jgi:hypothetical protein